MTPITKTLAFLLFILLPITGFILGTRYKQTPVIPSPTGIIEKKESVNGTVNGVVKYGPVSPRDVFCSASASNLSLTLKNSAGVEYKTVTDNQGNFNINLPAGTYTIQYLTKNNISATDMNNGKVTVTGGKTTSFYGCYDTHIR